MVLDTNVWISSLLLPNSIPGKIILSWQRALFGVITSQPILDEVRKVLNYPKIQKRLSVSQKEIEEYITMLQFFTDVVELNPNPSHSKNNLKDITDLPILATLINSDADYLITGDNGFSLLKKQYPILTPAEFANFL